MPRCLSAGPPSASDAAARSRAGMHSPYFGNQSDSTVPSTCLLSYLPPSLPGSQIPTVSAHVNSEITGHALTHVCFAFKRVISLCTQAVLGLVFFPSFSLFLLLHLDNSGKKTKPSGLQSQERGDGGDDGRDIGGASVCNDKVVFSPASRGRRRHTEPPPLPSADVGLSYCRSACSLSG